MDRICSCIKDILKKWVYKHRSIYEPTLEI